MRNCLFATMIFASLLIVSSITEVQAQVTSENTCAICGTWKEIGWFSVQLNKPRSHPNELFKSDFADDGDCFTCDEGGNLKVRFVYDASGLGFMSSTFTVDNERRKILLPNGEIKKDYFKWSLNDSLLVKIRNGDSFNFVILDITNEYMVHLSETSISIFIKQNIKKTKFIFLMINTMC